MVLISVGHSHFSESGEERGPERREMRIRKWKLSTLPLAIPLFLMSSLSSYVEESLIRKCYNLREMDTISDIWDLRNEWATNNMNYYITGWVWQCAHNDLVTSLFKQGGSYSQQISPWKSINIKQITNQEISTGINSLSRSGWSLCKGSTMPLSGVTHEDPGDTFFTRDTVYCITKYW